MRKTLKPPASKREAPGGPSVTSTKLGLASGDAQNRPTEEDLLLLHSLKLIGCADALLTWPELSSTKIELGQCMFSAPNRCATESLLYFLFVCLTDRESVKKEFKDVWPTVTASQAREFRARTIELIKEHADEWDVSSESISHLPALLQRHAGQKLVRLFCELSCTAMRSMLVSIDPEAEVGERHVEVEGGMEGSLLERLVAVKVQVGQAKIANLQERFLRAVAESRAFREEMHYAASEIMSHHIELISHEKTLQHEMAELQATCPQGGASENGTASDINSMWADIDTTTEALEVSARFSDRHSESGVEGVGRLASEILQNDRHPHAVSGEELLTLMTHCFGEEFVRQSLGVREDRESSFFGSESAISIGGHGKTEVDVLSMTWNWARCGVKELVDAMEPIGRVPRQAFVRDLLDDESMTDLINQTTALHSQNLEQLEKMKTQLLNDVEQLDIALDVEEKRTTQLMTRKTSHLPSLLSILEG